MSYTVYKHTGPTGKVYIGITGQRPENRWGQNGRRYQGNGHFWRAIQKYGWSSIKHEILADGLTKNAACEMEQRLIAEHHSTDPDKGYNKSTGGEMSGLGFKHTTTAREKIRVANTGKRLSAETRKKVSDARKGWSPSAETRAKISAANKLRPGPNRGKHPNQKTLERLRAAAVKKPVKNLDTGQTFPSINEAARASGLHQGAIWAVCNGRQKTHGGFRWAYEGVVA